MAIPILAASADRAACLARRAAAWQLVVIERSPWGFFATGTRAHLIAAGLCTAGHFPEGRKRTSGCAGGADVWWSMEKVPGGGDRWRLRIDEPRAQCDKRKAALKELSELESATADSHLGNVKFRVRMACAFLETKPNDECAGYSLDKASADSLAWLAARAAAVVASATVEFDAGKHAAALVEARKPLAGDDRPHRLAAPLRLVASAEMAAGQR